MPLERLPGSRRNARPDPVGIRSEAKHRLRIEDGKVSHVMLDPSRVFHKQVTWRVYMSSARKDGSVELDLHGRVLKVFD